MASSSSSIQNSSEEELKQNHNQMDERKRKRMESNRESARRSRMRKQKHLDNLTAQIAQLCNENRQILDGINVTNQKLVVVEADNSVLRAQMGELSQRLESLNEMVNYLNTLSGCASLEGDDGLGFGGYTGFCEGYFGNFDGSCRSGVGLGYGLC